MSKSESLVLIMINNSEALQRIEGYFKAFRAAIERCRTTAGFDPADWQDAYGRLARLRDRCLEERPNLNTSEREALSKVFEHDTFTEGMMNIRQVAEHVKKRGDFMIRTTGNVPITLDSESSAMAVFSGPTVFLTDTAGNTHRLDHLEMLEEMEERIAAAISKARL